MNPFFKTIKFKKKIRIEKTKEHIKPKKDSNLISVIIQDNNSKIMTKIIMYNIFFLKKLNILTPFYHNGIMTVFVSHTPPPTLPNPHEFGSPDDF